MTLQKLSKFFALEYFLIIVTIMASFLWKDEIETIQSIFTEELQIVEQNKGYLLKYNVKQNGTLSIRVDGRFN